MELSLMYFATGEGGVSDEKYHLIIESARFADVAGLQRIWLPERHFVPFGSLHPNPSVLAAALARETHRVRLAAGSVVLPLHNPLRVAEEWAVVDNLSRGRVDLAFASGWHPNDFALAPGRYDQRYSDLAEGIEIVRRLWRGEKVPVKSGNGSDIRVRVYPTPIQAEVPIWVTAAKSPTTFRLAGQLGANVLTYLVDLGVQKLSECIAAYRSGREERGFAPYSGHVTVMLHTYVGHDRDTVRRVARKHYLDYLRANATFLTGAASALTGRGNILSLDECEVSAIAEHQFDRIFENLSFMGDVSSCLSLAHTLQEIGVTEIACLVDFVSDVQVALDGLSGLLSVRDGLRGVKNARVIASNEAAVPLLLDNKEDRWTPNLIQASLPHKISGSEFYERLLKLGGEYGPSFQVIESIWFDETEALALISPASGDGNESSYGLKPTTLDNCLSTLIATGMTKIQDVSGYTFGLPEGFETLVLNGTDGGRLWSHAIRHPAPAGYYGGDVRIFTDDGRCLAEARGLRFKKLRTDSRNSNIADRSVAYSIAWDQASLNDLSPSSLENQRWIICFDDKVLAEALAAQMRAYACEVVLFPLVATIDAHANNTSEPEPHFIAEAVREMIGGELNPCDGLIWLTVDEVEVSDRANTLVDRLTASLGLALALERLPSTPAKRQFCIVTREGQMAVPNQRRINPLAAAVWGIARSLAAEQQTSNIRLIDVDSEPDREVLAQRLMRSLFDSGSKRELALRNADCLCPRLRLIEDDAAVDDHEFYPRPDHAYLVTGGMGGIGLTLATWLAAKGARDIVLLGRTDPKTDDAHRRERFTHTISMLEHLGARVYCRKADVANPTELQATLDNVFADGCPPLAGIFHLAGIVKDGLFDQIGREAIKEITRPKISGTEALNRLANNMKLDFFVAFSSVAALVGSPGQTIYAAANAYMDALMLERRLQNKPGGTINWGPWYGQGMAEREGVSNRIRKIGLEPLEVQTALVVLSSSLSKGWAQVVVGTPMWDRLRQHRNGSAASPLLADFLEAGSDSASKISLKPAKSILEDLLTLSAKDQQILVQTHVIRMIAEAMQINSAEISPTDDLMGLNLSSLEAMDLRSTMQSQYGVTMPISVFLQARTIADLTTEVLSRLLISQMTADTYARSENASGDVMEL